MVDFLYGTNWRRFVEEKCEKNAKIEYFWTKPVGCTGTGSVVPVQGCNG